MKDTGIGMHPEFVQHIFEPFERERNSTISGIQGTEFVINFEFRLQKERKQMEVIQELEGLRTLVVDDDFNACDSIAKMLRQIGMRSVPDRQEKWRMSSMLIS